MGTPFERCSKVFDEAVVDCKAKLGPLFNWMCSVAYMVSSVCYTVKFLDYICALFEFVSDEIVSKVKKKFREFAYRVRNIFYVSIEYNHSFEITTNQSKPIRDITAGIALEIRQRTGGLLTLFDWMSFAFSFFFLYMIFQTIHYKRKFLTQDWYDNRFITDNIIMLDLKRTYMGRETILPLNFHERKKYISLTSWRLVANERRRLAKTAIFLSVATIKLSIHMLADYSLFWILNMIKYHGQFQTELDAPSNVEVRVSGTGMVANFFQSIINAFQPKGLKYDLDTKPCLPEPKPPDIGVYKQIVTLIVMTWILAILEPYGLRLRHYVMSYYYPQIARQRAVWLYNHILRSRGSFIKFARRQLRRKFNKGVAAYGEGIEKVGLMDRLRALCPIMRRICPGSTSNFCILCGTPTSPNNPVINCPSPGCPGKYCGQCYTTLNQICTLCKSPIEYGDLSDVSEERDSSEEDYDLLAKKLTQSMKKKKSSMIKKSQAKVRSLLQDSEGSGSELSSEKGNVYELDAVPNLDTTDSELSYSYQERPRPLGDRPSFALAHDVEAQKTVDRVTIDTFEEPVDEFYKDEQDERNLADRKKSSTVRSLNNFFFPPRTSEDSHSAGNPDLEGQRNLRRDSRMSDSVLNTKNNPRIYMMARVCDERSNQVTPWVSHSLQMQYTQYSISDETFQTRQRKNVKSAKQVYENDKQTVDSKQSVNSWEVDNFGINFSKMKYEGPPAILPVECDNINKAICPSEKVQSWLNFENFKEYPIDKIPIKADIEAAMLDVKVREINKGKKFGIFSRIKEVFFNVFRRKTPYEILSETDTSKKETETEEETSESESTEDKEEEHEETLTQEIFSEHSKELVEETLKEESDESSKSVETDKTETQQIFTTEEESIVFEAKEPKTVQSETSTTEFSGSPVSATELTSGATTEIEVTSGTTVQRDTTSLISFSSDSSTVDNRGSPAKQIIRRDFRQSYQGADNFDWASETLDNERQRNNQQEENRLDNQEASSSLRLNRPSFRSLKVKESKAQQMYKMFK
ncbi:uncharacterized protein isoform X2 [Rhodnius prolixus]